MTFWMIRLSNTWKIAIFKTPLVTLNVETLDTVTIDLAQPFIANIPVRGVVNSASYNPETSEIEYEVQTEVFAGRLDVYPLFWPAGGEAYPTAQDEYPGGAS